MKALTLITDQLNKDPRVTAAKDWYGQLPGRDRNIVNGVAIFAALAIVFSIVFAPMLKRQDTLAVELDKQLALYNLMANNGAQFNNGTTGVNAAAEQPLLAVVTQQARKSNITLTRYEQDGSGLRIWLENVSFDDTITWLEALNSRFGIVVNQINIDKDTQPGRVDIRATLVRAGS
ncbi:General secretion pathway protein M [hydrothermal vent metagenome]|jgi:general secretion pathway protein M|uniref:General secretion pathway protein M n=1 Tax=hydrothermal vent metagenome TaxID=652676 RepID=A0A161KC13_9ZZZZ|nr:type II secretion system protein M [Thalassolituus oleivorans]